MCAILEADGRPKASVRPTIAVQMASPVEQFKYRVDCALQKHPVLYFAMLLAVTLSWVVVGGLTWYAFRIKRSGKRERLRDTLWLAWSCVAASSTHTKEREGLNRFVALCMTLGGLASYSVFTGAASAQLKARFEQIRTMYDTPVLASNHAIIAGRNAQLPRLLEALDSSHEYAKKSNPRVKRKTVLLLVEEKASELLQFLRAYKFKGLDVYCRQGSLSNALTFVQAGSENASQIVLLANSDDRYQSDSSALISLLALGKSVRKDTNLVIQTSKQSTGKLLSKLATASVLPVRNQSPRLLVLCARQDGLAKILREMLAFHGPLINLRKYPQLEGLPYRHLRQGFDSACVVGIMRGNTPIFSPADNEILRADDTVLVLAPKQTHTSPPEALVAQAQQAREGMLDMPGCGSKVSSLLPMEKLELGVEQILICGWRAGTVDMLVEFDKYVPKGSVATVLAEAPVTEREAMHEKKVAGGAKALKNLHVIHIQGNPLSETDMNKALDATEAGARSTASQKKSLTILTISNHDWIAGDAISSGDDKRTIFSALLAESIVQQKQIENFSILAEVVSQDIMEEMERSHPSCQYLSTVELQALFTAQVLEHRELLPVWEELTDECGSEIYVKNIRYFAELGQPITFRDLEEVAFKYGQTAIGYRWRNRLYLNPTPKTTPIVFQEGDALVVIAEHGGTYKPALPASELAMQADVEADA